jgi:hypothetical protein
MNITKQPLRIRLFFALGILMATTPMFINEYIKIPDFLRGFLTGAGLAMEIIVLVKINRNKSAGSSC